MSNPLKSSGVVELEIVVLYNSGESVMKIRNMYVHMYGMYVYVHTYVIHMNNT